MGVAVFIGKIGNKFLPQKRKTLNMIFSTSVSNPIKRFYMNISMYFPKFMLRQSRPTKKLCTCSPKFT